VRLREHLGEIEPMPFRPDRPVALDAGSRVDEHAVQVEQDCLAANPSQMSAGNAMERTGIEPVTSGTWPGASSASTAMNTARRSTAGFRFGYVNVACGDETDNRRNG
jgi:hypothetical protein